MRRRLGKNTTLGPKPVMQNYVVSDHAEVVPAIPYSNYYRVCRYSWFRNEKLQTGNKERNSSTTPHDRAIEERFMMTRPTGKAAAVFVAAALISSACSSQDVSSGTTDETPVEQPPTTESPLTLGYLLPETGMLAFVGPPMVSGVQLAVQAINDAGGVLGSPIQLLSADEGDDADLALAQANRLIASGVQAIIGAAASGITEAVMADVTKAGVVQCSPSN